MLKGLELDHAMAIKEQAESNGLFFRFIHWSSPKGGPGFQVGAFWMSPTGWAGRCSEWHKEEYKAWLEAESIVEELLAKKKELEKKELEEKDELRASTPAEDRRSN